MRSLGLTRIAAYCRCGHQSLIDMSDLPGDLAMPDVRLQLRCSKSGERPMATWPDWTNYRAKGTM
jgi:hypothetical protein